MSTAARIDELRNRYQDNPRRYFASYANELRRMGALEEAIAVCREQLPQAPGHMSGYIVFGQALFESDQLQEARRVFESGSRPEISITCELTDASGKHTGHVSARWTLKALRKD